jgi:hypothetical protein
LQVLISRFIGTGKHALRCPEYQNVEVSNMPHLAISPPGLCLGRYDLFSYDHSFISVGIYQGESPTSCQWNSRIPDHQFPKMGNLMTRGLSRSGGPDLSRGFHPRNSRTLVTRTPEFTIPDFPKWEISRHVASVIQTVHIYPEVFTMESPDPLGV